MSMDSMSDFAYNRTHYQNTSRYDVLLDRFAKGITEWSKSGNEPSGIGRDLNYSLKLMEQRRKEYGVSIITEYETPPDSIRGAVPRKGNYYDNTMVYKSFELNKQFLLNGRELKKKRYDINLYTNVTDVRNYRKVYEEQYNCPNCGAIVRIKDLEQGCPYCDTKFKMPELFPKITSYNIVETLSSNRVMKEYKISIITGIVLAEIIMLTNMFRGGPAKELIFMIIQLIFSVPVTAFSGAFLGLLIFGIIKIVKIFGQAGKSVSLLSKTSGSKKRLTQKMRQTDENFSYEYFESKLLTLLQMVVFSASPHTLTLYEGQDELEWRTDIVDMLYRGAGFRRFKVENGICYVQMEVFVTDTVFNADNLTEKNESFLMTVAKRPSSSPENFEISKVKCHFCGGSFDAMHIKKCPFCDREYSMIDDDWVVLEVKRIKR